MTEKVNATIEDVKPETAETWLGKNDRNRNVRQRLVLSYARDMESGNWQLTGEAIKFSRTGRLLDGQHRLHAVVLSGRTIKLLVVRGLPDRVQDVIDSGAARTAGDALRLRGEALYSSLAAAARLAILYNEFSNLSGADLRPTHAEILRFVDENPDIKSATDMAVGFRNAIDVPVSVLTVACWVLARVDPDDTHRFFSQLAEKTDLKGGDAVLALLNRLADIRRNGRRASRNDYLSLIFRAWNYWRGGTKVNTLPLKTRDGSGVLVPEPK